MFEIQMLNPISEKGLDLFASQQYRLKEQSQSPAAILVRSANMHDMAIPESVQVIGRAGAGTNNIPVEQLTRLGVPVLNTPGANANAVKELVLTGMLLASRNICLAWDYLRQLSGDEVTQNQQVEKNKKQFVGTELPGKTLAVIGLGHVGVEVANSARYLGMNVVGYDPAISVKNAWKLRSSVVQADSIKEAVSQADFVTLHVPLIPQTRNLVDQALLSVIKAGAVLMNFARSEIVCQNALKECLDSGHLKYYVCDFPLVALKHSERVICLPHLGASTHEAQENCAVMIVQQIQSFLQHGHIYNSVNFPDVKMSRNGQHRVAIVNRNIPDMVAQIATTMSGAGLNILDMINKSKNEVAYSLIDLDQFCPPEALQAIQAIEGVVRVHLIPA